MNYIRGSISMIKLESCELCETFSEMIFEMNQHIHKKQSWSRIDSELEEYCFLEDLLEIEYDDECIGFWGSC